MAKREGAASLAVDVYARIRAEIVDGGVGPGERLMPGALAERYGVGVGVVREALGLLAAQGLVLIERNRGFRVTTVSTEALADLTAARRINEGAALRLSVELGDVAWESEVLAAHHRMASLPMVVGRKRNRAWAEAHVAFHHALIAACGNEVLLGICDRLSDAAELYRAWSAVGDGGRDVAGEHKRLMDAALAHDGDKAVRLFEKHIDRTADSLRARDLVVPAARPRE